MKPLDSLRAYCARCKEIWCGDCKVKYCIEQMEKEEKDDEETEG